MSNGRLTLALIIALGAGSVDNAAAKPVRAVKPTSSRPAAMAPREVQAAPQNPPASGGMMTPKAVSLRATTAPEAEANAVWSTRAALNVAALQCQFSPFLATVRNYNDFLRQHGEELDRARVAMTGHFRRYDGAQAQNSFDRYTTQTYNSYSTLDAQFEFCEQAALAGRMVLTIPKGKLGARAIEIRDHVRAALTPVDPHAFLSSVELAAVPLPAL